MTVNLDYLDMLEHKTKTRLLADEKSREMMLDILVRHRRTLKNLAAMEDELKRLDEYLDTCPEGEDAA